MPRGRLFIAAGLVVAAAAVFTVLVAGSSGSDDGDLLPDLDQAAPGGLSGRTGGTFAKPRFFLGFESAAGNVGEGPLVILGSRRSRNEARMRVVQRIDHANGATSTEPIRPTLRYVRSAGHAHWHLLGFMRYELRRAGKVVRPDRKTGFCLGDRYRLKLTLERTPPTPSFPEECGKNGPGRVRVQEGISVGYGDDYDAHVEGQEFDVTSLPAGRYVLVHRVNSGRLLRESDYENNAASLAFDLTWPRGMKLSPRVDVVGRCPQTATCP
ncbi:MAG: hypothetical protein H0V45_01435 [Actinobacteria bacterium]|nr:hypothetical protein [Actinomycetota bacterium]